MLRGDADAPVVTVKLADFGIAQAPERGSSDPGTRPTEATLGTASYLSPEQALGGDGSDRRRTCTRSAWCCSRPSPASAPTPGRR